MEAQHAPILTPLPEAPPRSIMSEAQWDTLFALMDGIIPAFVPSSKVDNPNTQISIPDEAFDKVIKEAAGELRDPAAAEQIEAYFRDRAVDRAEFQEDVLRALAAAPALPKLAGLMNMLGTRMGSLAFTGYITPIAQQPTSVRQQIVKSWATARLGMFRGLAKTMSTIAQKAQSVTSSQLAELNGFTAVPKGWEAREGFPFNFIQMEAGSEPQILTTDVVIVGSGCGGGVTAKNLAEDGHEVMVVDKGYYFPPNHLPLTSAAANQYLFEGGGIIFSDTASTGILAGGAWGGGGTVNWSLCLRTQKVVRDEWAAEGLKFFETKGYDECMDRVADFMGAGTDAIRHNHRNRVLMEGSKKLGWEVRAGPQNTAGKEHYCGMCHLGCGMGEKRGPAVSWLPAASDSGAEFMEGFKADKILFAEDGETAIGVEGVWTSRDKNGDIHTPLSERIQRKVIIKAKRVVISCGSLWSPTLLQKSGVQNAQLGQNLHVHPCNIVSAVYDEVTNPWEGGIITNVVSEFENLDGKGHGAKLEPTCMVPGAILPTQPWVDGLDSKKLLLKFRNMASFISLTRDRDTGSIFPDPVTGAPSIKYDPSAFDQAHTLEGVIGIAKLCYVTGATEIWPHYQLTDKFVPDRAKSHYAEGKDPEFTDESFAAWIRKLRSAGNAPPRAVNVSAHQMGTCRMATSPERGVTNEKGRVWGRKNLYVADASLFPSASGTNPMMTVMSIADFVSRGISDDLNASKAD